MRLIAAAFILWIAAAGTLEASCRNEDFETRISGDSECLLMRRYGSMRPATMVVWFHGNLTSGNPADYHFTVAKKAAEDFASRKIMSVAIVRPGYPDGTGASSTGNEYGRGDNWGRHNTLAVGAAVERLRAKFLPQRVILVGHSGGAALAAALLGMKSQLAEAAVLVACPCDLVSWRAGRRGPPWSSENPLLWVDKVNKKVRVIALTGSKDTTTHPDLAKTYIEALSARGIDAVFRFIPDEGHGEALRSAAVAEAIGILLQP